MRLFISAANQSNPRSVAARLRRRRHEFFMQLIAPLPRPIRILDVGGREIYWRQMGFCAEDDCSIVLLNLKDTETSLPNISGEIGDGTSMPQYAAGAFDVVFSNSVIEHLHTWESQVKMANEIQRVGKRYFVQTPNRFFPIEPHFHVPFFQFMPLALRIYLLQHHALGHNNRKLSDDAEAERMAREIRLLSLYDMRRLFPGAKFYKEHVFGVLKSFVAYGGW